MLNQLMGLSVNFSACQCEFCHVTGNHKIKTRKRSFRIFYKTLFRKEGPAGNNGPRPRSGHVAGPFIRHPENLITGARDSRERQIKLQYVINRPRPRSSNRF